MPCSASRQAEGAAGQSNEVNLYQVALGHTPILAAARRGLRSASWHTCASVLLSATAAASIRSLSPSLGGLPSSAAMMSMMGTCDYAMGGMRMDFFVLRVACMGVWVQHMSWNLQSRFRAWYPLL